MFTILWFLFIAFTATISLVWILDHNGSVVITWLGYETKTDILTALLIAIILAAVIFALSYLLARILALKFPNLFKFFFKKSYIKRLESLIHKHWQGINILSELLPALESDDLKSATGLQKKLSVLIKNPQLNEFFLGKIAYENKEFEKAAAHFEKISNNKYAHLLELKAKFELAVEKKDTQTAIAYAKQILSSKVDSYKVARSLLLLYRKVGLWQEARALISQYGIDKFDDELKKREIASINSSIAFDFYKKKNYAKAIKYCKIALKFDEYFLPALEIKLKSLIRRGHNFCASRLIKKLWKENPHLIFAEIFDLINRKKTGEKRLHLMKKMARGNAKTYLSDLAVGITALRVGKLDEAQQYLQNSLAKHDSYRANKALSIAKKMAGDKIAAQEYLQKANLLSRENNYSCNNCNHLSAIWADKCPVCSHSNSYEWGK